MSKPTSQQLPAAGAGARHRRSAHGHPFDMEDDVWRLRDHGNREAIVISSIAPYLAPALLENAKTVFAAFATIRPASSTAAIFDRFRGFVRLVSAEGGTRPAVVDAEHIAHRVGQGLSGTSITHLKTVTTMWAKLRVSGSTQAAVDLAERLVRPTDSTILPGVRSWEPHQGPYRPADDQAIPMALDDAINVGTIELYDYALVRVFRGAGARPDQVAALKVEDLRQDHDRWFIRIPMSKQRGSGWRDAFLPWKPVLQGFANVLQMHIEASIRPLDPSGERIDKAALFPRKTTKVVTDDYSTHYRPIDIRTLYKSAMANIAPKSPITGEIITGTPKRDRHTFLTYLAMNGCTAEEIAANAGQSKVSSCEAYVDASIDHFQRMERLVGTLFVPIADRFVGDVVSSRNDEKADAMIIDDFAAGVGTCAIGGCNVIETGAAPLACYTCRKFRAWSDGPHADLLDFLITEQERLRADRHEVVAETTTATIVAINDLLERIRQEVKEDA